MQLKLEVCCTLPPLLIKGRWFHCYSRVFTATSGENFTFFSFHIIYGELTIPQVFLLLFFSKEFTYDLLHLQKVNSPVWPKLSEHQKKTNENNSRFANDHHDSSQGHQVPCFFRMKPRNLGSGSNMHEEMALVRSMEVGLENWKPIQTDCVTYECINTQCMYDIYIYILYVNIICIYIYIMYIYFLRNNVLPYMNLMKYFDGLQYLNILTLDIFFKKRFVFALKWCLLRHRVLDTITIAYINHDPRVGCFFQWPCKSAIVRCFWKLGWCQAY